MEPFQSTGFQGCWSLICVKLMSRITHPQPPGASEARSEAGLVCTLVRVFDGRCQRMQVTSPFCSQRGRDLLQGIRSEGPRPFESCPSALLFQTISWGTRSWASGLGGQCGESKSSLWLRGLLVLLRTLGGERWLMGSNQQSLLELKLCPLPLPSILLI